MSYEGSCHCGAVTFSVEAEAPTKAMSCNCSHCRRKGFLLTFVPAKNFRLTAGDDSLTEYFFNKHNIAHRFCQICGCQTHGEGKGPDGAPTAAVNLRCAPEIDLDALEIQKVDGATF